MTHRLFPALVALWCAALGGLGCLAAGADALAALVVHLHLPAILPAAAPPLGLTARLVLGLALAGLGGAIGLAIGVALFLRAGGKLPARPARPVAAPAPREDPVVVAEPALRVRSRDAHPDAPPRRPLVVTEDVLPYPTAMVEPAAAPEPAGPTEPDAISFDHGGPGQTERPFDPNSEPADLPPFLAAAMSAVNRNSAPVVVAPSEPIIVPAFDQADMPEAREPEVVEHEVVEAVAVEPLADEHETVEPAPEPVVVHAPVTPLPLASVAAAAPKTPLDELPLASLGLVQLIERLALAIATRQAHRAAVAAAEPEPVDPRMPLHRFDPLSMDPTGPLLRTKKSRGDTPAIRPEAADDQVEAATITTLPDPLATMGDWHDDHEAEPLPARFLGAGAAQADTADEDAHADHDAVEHRYSSLAEMALPRPELVPFVTLETATPGHDHDAAAQDDRHGSDRQGSERYTPDPVVPFPSRLTGGDTSSALAPGDADRALREALATLRQMSAQR